VYCTAGATSLSFEKIANVTFADIDNSSTSTAGYEDFTTVVGNVSRGSAYDINLDISDPYETDELLVWIDYDQNGVFSANELAYNSAIAEGPYSGSITIPVDAPLGETRMRVRLHDTAAGANATPCGTSTYGQVEDYTIDIDVSTGLVEATSIATSVFPNPNMGDFSVRYGGDATFAGRPPGPRHLHPAHEQRPRSQRTAHRGGPVSPRHPIGERPSRSSGAVFLLWPGP
jgi:hypothetical protein